MKKTTISNELISSIIELYTHNQEKGKYWIANELKLNKNTVSSIIDRMFPNKVEINKELELKIIEAIILFPYTGTKEKICKYLKISKHSLEQIIHKTEDKTIINHFNTPKTSTHKLTDSDIIDILEGSKKRIGNDKMGLIKGIDGISIRNIRKKFLSSKEYEEYHSIERFLGGDYNAYYNNRGDKFLSTWEEKVADYLFKENIKYFSNIRFHHSGKNYSPDFYLPKTRTFIEVFGMSNVENYKVKMKEKIHFYLVNNIEYLALYEEDFILNKKYVDVFKNKIDKYLLYIDGKIFNEHINKIYINNKK
jgi:hypothetical protein